MAANINRGYPVPPQSGVQGPTGPPSGPNPVPVPAPGSPTMPNEPGCPPSVPQGASVSPMQLNQMGPMPQHSPGMRPPDRPMGLQHAGPPPNRQYGSPAPVYKSVSSECSDLSSEEGVSKKDSSASSKSLASKTSSVNYYKKRSSGKHVNIPCTVCYISLNSDIALQRHIIGKKHQKKLKRKKEWDFTLQQVALFKRTSVIPPEPKRRYGGSRDNGYGGYDNGYGSSSYSSGGGGGGRGNDYGYGGGPMRGSDGYSQRSQGPYGGE